MIAYKPSNRLTAVQWEALDWSKCGTRLAAEVDYSRETINKMRKLYAPERYYHAGISNTFSEAELLSAMETCHTPKDLAAKLNISLAGAYRYLKLGRELMRQKINS